MTIIQSKATNSYTVPNSSQVIYVSPTAQDNGSGTQSNPAKLSKVSDLAKDGAVVVLRGGTYTSSLVVSDKVTIQPYPSEFPIIDGRDVIEKFVQKGSTWVKTDYSVVLPEIEVDARDTNKDYHCAANYQQIWLDDAYLEQVQTLAQLAPGKFYVEVATSSSAGKLYLGEDPQGKTVRGVSRGTGIQFSNRAAGSVLKGVTVIGHGNYNIDCVATDVAIDNCAVGYSSYVNISPHTNTLTRNCLVTGAGKTNFLHGWANSGITIEDSTISDGNKRNFNPAWGAGTLKFVNTSNLTIRNCTIIGNPRSTAVWLDVRSEGCKVHNNRIVGANIGGFNEISGKNYFVDNVFEDCNVGLMSCASNGTEIVHNTFRRNNIDILVKDDERIDHGTKPPTPYTQKALVLKNNYFEDTKRTIIKADPYNNINSDTYFGEVTNNQFVLNGKARLAIITKGGDDKRVANLAELKALYPEIAEGNSETQQKPQQRLKAAPNSPAIAAIVGKQPDVVGALNE